MLFATSYPILYLEHHFRIGYLYPPDSLELDMVILNGFGADYGAEIILFVYTPTDFP
jgi:hypothetical protein